DEPATPEQLHFFWWRKAVRDVETTRERLCQAHAKAGPPHRAHKAAPRRRAAHRLPMGILEMRVGSPAADGEAVPVWAQKLQASQASRARSPPRLPGIQSCKNRSFAWIQRRTMPRSGNSLLRVNRATQWQADCPSAKPK